MVDRSTPACTQCIPGTVATTKTVAHFVRSTAVGLKKNRKAIALGLIIAGLVAGCLDAAELSNPVLDELVNRGVALDTQDGFARLPVPSMPDGMTAAEQHELIKQIAGPRRPLELLLRKSVVAPFVLKIRKHDSPGADSPSRRVDLWCVVFGDLELISNEEFLNGLAKMNESSGRNTTPFSSQFLSEEDLLDRDLQGESGRDSEERYFYVTFPLVDRVFIRATRHAYTSRTDESVLAAAILDPRFSADEQFPNQWQPITYNNLGKPELGAAKPYAGAGFYIKITRLVEPAGALFVEYHQVFQEPLGWFNGTNLLRSKLPLVVQDTVRKFRRRLANASIDAAGGG